MKTGRFSARGLRRSAVSAIPLALFGGAASAAHGQTAYFSFQGGFSTAGDKQDFNFNLSRSVTSAETLGFVTFSRDGGTTSGGDVISPNPAGIDSVLEVFDAANNSRGFNDDRGFGSLDSLVSWPAFQTGGGTPLNPSPLPSGNYRLNLIEFGNNATGPWSVDLVGPANAMTFNSTAPTGTSSISGLQFGTTGAGASPAVFNGTGTLNVGSAGITVGRTGTGSFIQTSGTSSSSGTTQVNNGSTFTVNGGTFNSNGEFNMSGGTFTRSAGGAFNLASGKTFFAQSGAQATFSTLDILAGRTFSVLSGADLISPSFIDISGGTLNVSGSGSTLSTGVQSFWGVTGGSANVTLSSGATATLGGGILLGQSFDGTFTVQGGSTATLNGSVGISTSNVANADGLLKVSGASSNVTVSGSHAVTIGSAANGSGGILVESGGVFDGSDGVITVNKTGYINVTGGSFFCDGNMTFNDGGYFEQSGGAFQVLPGKTVTLNNGSGMVFQVSHVVGAGTTYNVNGGSNMFSLVAPIHVADAGIGTATLNVSGANSIYVSTGDTAWGRFGAVANVTLSNSAEAQVAGRLDIASLTQAGTGANVTIQSAADLEVTGAITLASDGAGGGTGTVTVNGGSLTQTGATDFTIGHATTGTATLNVQGAGIVSTGTGTLTVNKTGTVNGGGNFSANGNVNINGGKFYSTAGTLTFATNRTLTVQNAGLFEYNRDGNLLLNAVGSNPLITGTGSILRQTDSVGPNDSALEIDGLTAFVTLGGEIEAEYLRLSNGSLTVDGMGSTLDASHAQNPTAFGATHLIGVEGPATLTLRNNAVGSFAGTLATLTVLGGGLASAHGTINVESGADLTVGSMLVSVGFSGAANGTVTVTGAGSTLFQNGAATLGVGAGSEQTGTINVNSGAFFTTGTGAISIFATGTINLGGGTFLANGDVSLFGGKVMQTTGAFAVQSGKTLTANSNALMSFATTHTVGGTYNFSGGADITSTAAAINVGDADVGTLSLTGGNTTTYTSGAATVWGRFGGVANVTFSNAATGAITAGGLEIASGTQTGTTGIATIQSDADVTVAGPIRIAADGAPGGGAGTLTVTGSGSTFIQSGVNGFTIGHASTSTATLNVNTDGTVTTGTGASAINKTGTVNIGGGTFNVNGDLTLNNGKLLHTAGTFNLAAGKNLTASNAAQVNLAGTYVLNGGSTFTIQSGSSLSVPTGMEIGVNSGNTGTLVVTGLGSSVTASLQYLGDAGGIGNLTVASQATANLTRATLLMGHSGSTANQSTMNVTSGGQVTMNSIRVAPLSGGLAVINVTGANSKITQNAASTLEVGGHTNPGVNATINLQTGGTWITGTGLTRITARGKVDNAGGTFTAAAVQNDGALISTNVTTTNAITGTGATTVNGGTLTANGSITQGSLAISNNGKATIAANSALSRINTLNFSSGGRLDLTNNDLVVTGSNGTTVRNQIITGFAGGQWNGNGIQSSTAATDFTSGDKVQAIGYVDMAQLPPGTTTFAGISGLDGNDVIVKHTYYGDADLGGTVDLDDFGQLLAGLEGDGTGWLYGDFDYNGSIDLDDFGQFLAGFDFGGAPLSAMQQMVLAESLSRAVETAMLNAIAAVPEPSGLILLGLGGLTARRRRRRSIAVS